MADGVGRIAAVIQAVALMDQLHGGGKLGDGGCGFCTVTTRYADHGEGPVTISDEQTFDQSLPEGGHFVTPYRRGRFYELEFGSPGTPWELSGWDHDAVSGGRR